MDEDGGVRRPRVCHVVYRKSKTHMTEDDHFQYTWVFAVTDVSCQRAHRPRDLTCPLPNL